MLKQSKLSLAVISTLGILGFANTAHAQGPLIFDESGTQSFDSELIIDAPRLRVSILVFQQKKIFLGF